eukprot:TRINITY_DN11154_c0_g1_i1.p1 TRINITY_DN11154_c0_g1~~TRINITY_DN11154_c0_g1_i1.p1  ORF type:complete len:411 (-),score=87.14 TRINITY_DN11154_c0_g1_i1:106-1338(-)
MTTVFSDKESLEQLLNALPKVIELDLDEFEDDDEYQIKMGDSLEQGKLGVKEIMNDRKRKILNINDYKIVNFEKPLAAVVPNIRNFFNFQKMEPVVEYVKESLLTEIIGPVVVCNITVHFKDLYDEVTKYKYSLPEATPFSSLISMVATEWNESNSYIDKEMPIDPEWYIVRITDKKGKVSRTINRKFPLSEVAERHFLFEVVEGYNRGGDIRVHIKVMLPDGGFQTISMPPDANAYTIFRQVASKRKLDLLTHVLKYNYNEVLDRDLLVSDLGPKPELSIEETNVFQNSNNVSSTQENPVNNMYLPEDQAKKFKQYQVFVTHTRKFSSKQYQGTLEIDEKGLFSTLKPKNKKKHFQLSEIDKCELEDPESSSFVIYSVGKEFIYTANSNAIASEIVTKVISLKYYSDNN